jgi:hypothetical protein
VSPIKVPQREGKRWEREEREKSRGKSLKKVTKNSQLEKMID